MATSFNELIDDARSCLPIGELFDGSSSIKSTSSCSGSSFGRRLVVAGGAAFGAAIAAGAAAAGVLAAAMFGREDQRQQAILVTRRGMSKFVQGDVEGSLQDFDRALELDERQRPYLWQRGLTLYYLDRFEEAAKQFRDDVAVNPNDTEESIWCYLSEARLLGPEEARRRFLQVGRDSRRVMRTAYELFRDGGSVDELVAVGAMDDGGHDTFYATLYVGLYHEAQGDDASARAAITAAVKTPYGSRSGDYMAKLAAVHCERRGWEIV